MKKLALCICLAMVILLVGCEVVAPANTKQYESSETIDLSFLRLYSELPFDVPYEESFFTVKELYIYEDEVGFAYRPYFILVLDVSKLSDKQRHYLLESDLDDEAIMRYEGKDISLFRANFIHYTDMKEFRLYYTNIGFGAPTLRDSIDGSEFRFDLRAGKDPQYKSTLDLPYYSYVGTFEGPFDPTSKMNEYEMEKIIEGLENFADFLSGID